MPFFRVALVKIPVDPVIENIDGGRDEAEGGGREQGAAQQPFPPPVVREDEPGQNKAVLDPLARPEQTEVLARRTLPSQYS